MSDDEDITDCVIRTEMARIGLCSEAETVSHNLVIAMLLNGLPEA